MNRSTVILLAAAMMLAARSGSAQDAETSKFTPDPTIAPPADGMAPPASFVGKAVKRDASGRLVPIVRQPAPRSAGKRQAPPIAQQPAAPRHSTLSDYYVQDGSETAFQLNPWNVQNLVAAFNQGWDFEPDIPLSNSTVGTTAWNSRAFPTGEGVYGGYPFNPWVVAQNAPGQFLTSLIRRDLLPSDNARVVIARSDNSGGSFIKWHEVTRDVFQDRAMFDLDRNATRGGVIGPQDGTVLLCYDDFSMGGGSYDGSYLRVLDAGGALVSETQISGNGTPPFRGSQFQPVAALTDGGFFFVSTGIAGAGATRYAYFHETVDAGATMIFDKSVLSWAPAGQRLGTTNHWGVNGHRIDQHGFLDIDRSSGVRRGTLYFLSNRNPNPTDATQDQGDVWVSRSFNNGASWTTIKLPTTAGRTQYFPMMDVDDQGWVHVAYYENGQGNANGGVLNAFTSNVLYTLSRDGGQTWVPTTQVNETANSLIMDDPPLELGAFDYYMLGDYMQIQAFGTGTSTAAYVLWTQYDTFRPDDAVGAKKERVMATFVQQTFLPGTTPVQIATLALTLIVLAAGWLAVRRRRELATARV